MSVFGAENPQVKMLDKLMPPRGHNIYNGGYKDYDKGYIRYALPSSDHPNLILVNAIYDDDNNIIQPGYYELVLSDDRQILLLVQAGNTIATIPVFRLEEDRSQEQLAQPMDWKSQKKADREKKKKDKLNKKLIKQGKMVEEPQVYMNATIEYDKEGDYYLVKYERGKIRAWGAIK